MTLVSIQSLNESKEYTEFYFNSMLNNMLITEQNLVDILWEI